MPNWSRPRASANLWSMCDLSEVFLGWWTHWLLIFPVLLFKASSRRFWRIVFLLFMLHVASMSLFSTYTVYCVQHVFLFVFHGYVYASIPEDRAILRMCVPRSHLHCLCGGVSREACRGSPLESGASTSNTCMYLSIFLWILSNAYKLYMHTQTYAQS